MSTYPVWDVDFMPHNDTLLITWEEAKEELLGGRLVRPETHRGVCYTGVVEKVGPTVFEEDLKPGVRVFFEQFSSPIGFIDAKTKKRKAIIKESACLAIIPHRVKVGSGDVMPDFNAD